MSNTSVHSTRRDFLRQGGVAMSAAAALAAAPLFAQSAPESNISPTEDLMREHALLERIAGGATPAA